MNLKNYTSGVPIDRSVSLIEHDLVRAGAQHIAKSYDEEGNLSGIIFQIAVNTIPVTFKLPSRWQSCFKVMFEEVRKPRPGTEERIREQAQRTAWKILSEWVAIQLSMIKLDQAEIIEVFLPYAYDMEKQQTFFERVKGNGFKMLTAGSAKETGK
jgi:hypothetical protein